MKVSELFEDEASDKQKRIQATNPNLSDDDAKKFVSSIKTSGHRPSKSKGLTPEEIEAKIKKVMALNPKLSQADARAFVTGK